MKKNIICFCIILLGSTLFALSALAAPDLGLDRAGNIGLTATNQDPRDAAVTIVRYLMTFLGIIAVIITLYGGFLWLTANGNEDRIEKAKKAIIAGIVGLVGVLTAFATVYFVVSITGDMLNEDL